MHAVADRASYDDNSIKRKDIVADNKMAAEGLLKNKRYVWDVF